MKILRITTVAVLPLLLAACLEVDQHPVWSNGEYDGKRDTMHHQTYYNNDRLSWNAVLTNRNHLQNEYNRTTP